MSKDIDLAEFEGELLEPIQRDFSTVLVAEKDDDSGMRSIFILPSRLLTHEEVLSTCKKLIPIIHRRIPERLGGWAAGIEVHRVFGPSMGCYYLGWMGHADEWRPYDQPTDHADWLALFQRLERLLPAPNAEGRGKRDVTLRDEDNGLPRQTLRIHRIEILTPDLVAAIQQVLKDGYPDWCVEVRLILPYSDRVPHEGIDIWSDQIVEHWDRRDLESKLGDRLKI